MLRSLVVAMAGAISLWAQTPVERSWSILEQGVANKDADTRLQAVRSLGLIDGNAKAQQMAERALADEKPAVQAAAADALGQMGARSSADKLIAALKGNDTTVVFSAANALYVLGDPRAYEVYYAVLLGERKSGDSLVQSQMKMLKDPKAMARMGIEQGIGFIPFAGLGVSAFKTITKDDTSPVRAAAAQKLVRDSDTKTSEGLMRVAADPKWLVRAAVIDAIAKRGDPALLKAVWPRLDDDNESVRFIAAAAILRLTK